MIHFKSLTHIVYNCFFFSVNDCFICSENTIDLFHNSLGSIDNVLYNSIKH